MKTLDDFHGTVVKNFLEENWQEFLTACNRDNISEDEAEEILSNLGD